MYGLGWKPDLPDFRDHVLAVPLPGLADLPAQVDFRPHCPPIEDQQTTSSCVGQSVSWALEYLYLRDGLPRVELSRLFPYYGAREIQGWTREDAGCYLRDAIKFTMAYGICAESLWPFDDRNLTRKPSSKAYQDGKLRRRLRQYLRLESLVELKVALASNEPVVFGFSVYESLYNKRVERTGIVPLPDKGERMLGGHAVVAVGYDDQRRVVICRNSWGANWGDHGYFYLPYDFIHNRNLSDDFWLMR